MSDNLVIYHNPRCSKSRATLAILKDRGLSVHEFHYLETAPSPCELEKLAQALDLEPLQFMRTGEKVFKELGLNKKDERSRSEWLQIMADNPILIERPIVVNGQRARLGRPPEQVLEIL